MRKIAVGLTVVATGVVGLLLLLPSLVSTDWARFELGRQLSTASGMNVRLEGPVRLSFLPRLAVVAKNIAISSEAGDLSIRVPEFSTAITLSSLWSDKLEIQSIELVEPAISLEPPPANARPEPAPSSSAKNDPFASLVGTLERLAVNRITIDNGSLTTADGAGKASTFSAIDADLKAPDLDSEVAFSLAATQSERRAHLNGTLSALRPILQRQPARGALEVKIEPAPSPLLAFLKADGEIRLNENGSYQITGGQFDLGGQAFQLDALFMPGDRHRFLADLTAKRVDIGALADAGGGRANAAAAPGNDSEPNLAMLSAIDTDISITIDRLVSGALAASDVQFTAMLRDGHLEANLEHLGLDAGSIGASISTDVAEATPTFQGKLISSGLDIGELAKLVGQSIPLSGKVTLDTVFAFRGLTAPRMRESLNVRGTVGIRQGKVPVAALTGEKGAAVGDITGLSFDAKIQDIAKPVDMSGKLDWQGQGVSFKAQVAPADFLSSPSIAELSGPVSLSLASKYLSASATGTVSAGATFKGKASVASPSLDRLLRWLGQAGSSGLRDFAFDGIVDASPQGIAFTNAGVGLNGVKASGEGAVSLGPPLKIRTGLNFAKLDFAALAGEGSEAVTNDKAAASSSDAQIDLSFLKELDAQIDVAADKIGYGKVFAGPVKTTLVVAGGKLGLTVPQSPFYGGTIAAELSADGSGEVPAIKLDMAIADAAAASLLNDAAGFNRLAGKLATNVAISGAGNTTKTLKRSLDGKAAVTFNEGAVRGIDIAEVYNNLVGLLSSGFKADESKKTAFTELGATFAINKGIAHTNDISLVGPLVRMDGAGKIDLAEQTMAINLNPRIVASLSGQGGDIEAKGIGVPVIVDGTLSEPRIYPDLSTLLRDPQGGLDMLRRLGLPTGKLGLDKLLPGQAGSDEDAKGAADLIGDLIKGGGANTVQENSGRPFDAESAGKALISDLIKGKAKEEAATTTLPELVPGDSQGEPEPSEKRGIGSLLNQLLR